MTEKVITIQNAGLCTAYELRQELNRRNAFDLDENKVNFKSLLQRLMVELVKDEAQKDAEKIESTTMAATAARDAAKAERERKKAEALERSRQRQANPDYFAKKGEANVEGAVLREKSREEASVATEVEEETVDEPVNDDPFRTYTSKSKNKIFVR